MTRIWPNGKSQPVDVWWEFGPRDPISTPAGPTSNFHWGIDLGPGGGTRMVSPVDGVITLSRWDDVFGNWVHVTENGTGDELWLCHLASRAVSVGQHVRAGDYIGPMGETGKANGRHLHYEYHPGGQDRGVDPRDFYRSGAAAGGSVSPAVPESEEDDEMTATFINIQGKAGSHRGGTYAIMRSNPKSGSQLFARFVSPSITPGIPTVPSEEYEAWANTMPIK